MFLANQKARNAIFGAENLLISDIPQLWLGDIQSCDVFRQIAQEQKDLMDYKGRYSLVSTVFLRVLYLSVFGSQCVTNLTTSRLKNRPVRQLSGSAQKRRVVVPPVMASLSKRHVVHPGTPEHHGTFRNTQKNPEHSLFF